MKVFKVGEIVNGIVHLRENRQFKTGDICAVLTNLDEPVNPRLDFKWHLEVAIGSPPRIISLELPLLLKLDDSLDDPVFLDEEGKLIYYCDRLFMPERVPASNAENEEIILRVKLTVFEEQAELSNLRAKVANLEAALDFSKNGTRRTAIPEDVKVLVWARDGGCCVRCGSVKELHYDHIIPVVKGGGNNAANIQILCSPCNLRKAARIAF